MTFKAYSDFVADEHGGVIVDWTSMVGALVGLGIGAVAAVQTGVFSLGGETTGSFAAATDPFTDSVLGSGGDVQINYAIDVYDPIVTDDNKFTAYLYELADKSKGDLSELYKQYLAEAVALLKRGDKEAAQASLDVAGAISEVMKDYRYSVPDSSYDLAEVYATLSGDVGKGFGSVSDLPSLDSIKEVWDVSVFDTATKESFTGDAIRTEAVTSEIFVEASGASVVVTAKTGGETDIKIDSGFSSAELGKADSGASALIVPPIAAFTR